MRKVMATAASTAVLLMIGAGPVLADEHESDAPPVRPIEGWTCTYNEGKGRADLDAANAAWNEWMDEHNQNDYLAFIMTPQFFGELNFDFAWIGVARDGHAFGAGTDLWLSEGGEVGAMFADAISCSSHSAFVSMNVKRMPPSDDDSPPPKAVFVVLDQPVPESAAGITLAQMPRTIGQLMLYGRQTDRDARLAQRPTGVGVPGPTLQDSGYAVGAAVELEVGSEHAHRHVG